jgi:23S rRNA (pseudouridine1915-N3)-methyltransferase
MKITLLVIGKTNEDFIATGIQKYIKRLVHYVPFELKTLPDIKNTKGITESQQKEEEGKLFLGSILSGDYVVLLDEKGKDYTSRQFSEYIAKKMNTVPKNLIFVIGGPYGFSQAMYERANEKLSLSKMTFSHEMIRLFFVEQIYRAMTILKGEPYHHD